VQEQPHSALRKRRLCPFCYLCLRNGQLEDWSALEDDFRTSLLKLGGCELLFSSLRTSKRDIATDPRRHPTRILCASFFRE
jgi:hypothetical protein